MTYDVIAYDKEGNERVNETYPNKMRTAERVARGIKKKWPDLIVIMQIVDGEEIVSDWTL